MAGDEEGPAAGRPPLPPATGAPALGSASWAPPEAEAEAGLALGPPGPAGRPDLRLLLEEAAFQALMEEPLFRRPPAVGRAPSQGEASLLSLPFPEKLWRIVSSEEFTSIWWDEDGACIGINEKLFQKEVLERAGRAKVFQTDSIKSFARQLNLYGFSKTRQDVHTSVCQTSFLHEGRPISILSKVQGRGASGGLGGPGGGQAQGRPAAEPGRAWRESWEAAAGGDRRGGWGGRCCGCPGRRGPGPEASGFLPWVSPGFASLREGEGAGASLSPVSLSQATKAGGTCPQLQGACSSAPLGKERTWKRPACVSPSLGTSSLRGGGRGGVRTARAPAPGWKGRGGFPGQQQVRSGPGKCWPRAACEAHGRGLARAGGRRACRGQGAPGTPSKGAWCGHLTGPAKATVPFYLQSANSQALPWASCPVS